MKQWDAKIIEAVYPIERLRISKNGIEVVRGNCLQQLRGQPRERGIRSNIHGLSKPSLHRLAFLVRTTKVKWKSIATLTYGPQYPTKGEESKVHLNRMLTEFRRAYDNLNYLWWLEWQKRGAPHYHMLLDVPAGSTERGWFAEVWSKIVAYDVVYSSLKTRKTVSARLQVFRVHNHSSAWEDIRQPEGAARYVQKYASKAKQKVLPPGSKGFGRWWGASRNVKKLRESYQEVDVDNEDARALVARYRPDVSDWDVLPKYICK